MAQRPIWRGQLRLALVACPVALYNARHEREALHFHLINPATGNRVKMVTEDAETGEELRRGDLVRGYQFEKGRYVILDEEDFESARTDSSTTMRIDKFVDAASIDPVYYDSSYYMAPDGDAADDVYGVLRQAIEETGKVALTRVVIARRERAVLIVPMPHGLAVHTLLEERDLNSAGSLFDAAAAKPVDPDMVQLAKQLIARQLGTYDPADVEDRYEARLRDVIAAKLKGEGVQPEAAIAPERGNVIDLMAALKKSLGQSTDAPPAKTKRPARAKPEPVATPQQAAKPTRKRA